MAEELELNLAENEDINRAEERIKKLSSKVKETSTERDEAAAKAQAEEAARLAAEKERDFFKGFSQVAQKYQGSTEYQDKIWDKVKSGYTVEDAAVAVLNAEGKFVPPAAPAPIPEPAAGGSAPTPPLSGETKPLEEMTHEEKRAALIEAERRGDISLTG